MELDPRHPTDA